MNSNTDRYLSADRSGRRSATAEHISPSESLSVALFGKKPDALIRSLRYQLVHSAAATLIEAAAREAEVGLLLVQEFYSASLHSMKLQQNSTDWANFVRAFPEMATAEVGKNQILGPISVPGRGRVRDYIPLYLVTWRMENAGVSSNLNTMLRRAAASRSYTGQCRVSRRRATARSAPPARLRRGLCLHSRTGFCSSRSIPPS